MLLVTFLLSLLLVPAFGQKTEGTIEGVVTDQVGAVVPNVPVTITNTGNGQIRSVTTSSGGTYAAPQLSPGNYQVAVKAPNFKESTIRDVEVHVASTTTVNVQLVVGSATEQIEVAANAIQVETGTAALGEVIDGEQVSQLPLNGRSFVNLTQLAPGVSGANNFDTKNKGLKGGVDFSVNGNPTTNNLFLIDGANDNDVGSNRTILLYPSNEAIGEFKMMRNAYGPEYGQASGGVINLITKGGSNQFHGSAFYNGRNTALNTWEYFAKQGGQKDVLHRNDYGFSIGGPVKKDKLFFFWSEEWNKELRGVTKISCVPTAAEQAGDFSQGVSCGANAPNIPLAFQALGNPLKIANPSPGGTLMIQKYPTPNRPTATDGSFNNWAQSEPSLLNWREENGRADFNINKSNSLMFRYTQDHWENPAPTAGAYWGDDIFPGLTSSWAQPSKQIVGKWTSTIGSSTVNDLEFAYSNNRINIGVGGTDPGLQAQISNAIGPLYPESLKTAPASIPTMWGGFGPYGHGQNYWVIAPWQNQLDIYTFRDDLSKVMGKHTLKVGAFIGRNEKDEDNGASSTERPTFGSADWDTTVPTGNNLANILIPQLAPDGVTQGAKWGLSESSTNVRNLIQWRDYEFYVGDNWKVTRRLTAEYGVRYSLMYSPYQTNGDFTSFQPSLYDPNKPASDACNGLWVVPGRDPCGRANAKFGTNYSAGINGPNKYLRNQNYHLFAPRLGMVWDPRGDGKMAVRFGIGQFFQRERVSPNNGLAANAPFSVTGNLQRALDSTAQIGSGGAASPSAGANPTSNLPSSWQWNFSIQQSLARDTALEIGYVGNRAMHLTSNYDINAVKPGATQDCNLPGGPFGVIPSWTCVAFLSSGAQNAYRPYSNFGAINYWDRNGDATYHSLQVLFKTKYKRSQLTAAYTWSHSITDVQLDNSSGGAGAQNYLDYSRPSLDRGNSAINRPQIFVANAYFYLPELKGANAFEKNTLGGWEMAVITTAASGNSHTVYQNGIAENSNQVVGTLNGLQSAIGTGYNEPMRPLLTGQACDAGRRLNQLYNPGAFTMVGYALGTIPNNMEPRGFCPGPHLINTDFSLDKNWKVTERFNVQFRMDFFNMFNHPNFRGDQVAGYTSAQNVNCGASIGSNGNGPTYAPCSPINNIISTQTPTAAFGQSNQTTNSAGRELQYSLRFTF
jgi:Carboxypeptidase regulatory-like domain